MFKSKYRVARLEDKRNSGTGCNGTGGMVHVVGGVGTGGGVDIGALGLEAKSVLPNNCKINEIFEKKYQKRLAAKLNQMAAKGHLSEFKKMCELDPKRLKLRDSKGSNPAHKAAEAGQITILQYIYDQDQDQGALFNKPDKKGSTALHVAVRAEQTAAIGFLLDHGADSVAKNNEKLTPLHYAVDINSIKSLKALLIHNKIDPNETADKGQTALHYCAMKDRHECAKLLLEHSAKPCQKCDNGFYPINVAGKCASAKTLEILIKHVETLGYKREEVLSFCDKENNMPLHCAVNSGDTKAVEVCLQAGAPVDAKQEDLSTPLHFACTQGSLDMVEMMCELQPERFQKAIQTKDVLMMTPLHRAALFDHVTVVEFLLKHITSPECIQQGADIDARDSHNRTPLLLASSKGGWRTVHSLLRSGADLSIKDKENRNFLHLAIRYGMPVNKFGCAVIKNLKNLLNERDDMGCTPLHYASKEGHLVAIDDLLKLGALINPKDNDKKSPLHFAARYGRFNTCRRLLESAMGPNIINETDGDGMSALHSAAQNGHTKIIKLLMEKGAYITKDNNNNTPLHLAAENGYTRSMRKLLTVYPNLLDTHNKEGQTSLHMAATTGKSSAVEMLLDLGASFTANKSDDTFFDIAIRERHTEVAYTIIHHARWEEALDLCSKEFTSPLNGLVQFLPDICLAALDRCHTTSSHDKRKHDFWVKFNFKYLQSASCSEKDKRRNGEEYTPMLALNTMVQFGRVQCLSHTVTEAFLNMKWRAYGSWFHITNLIVYAIYLGLITSVITKLNFPFRGTTTGALPIVANATFNTSTSAAQAVAAYKNNTYNNTYNTSTSDTSIPSTSTQSMQTFQAESDIDFKLTASQRLSVNCMLVISVLNVIKEILQIIQQRKKYFTDMTNLMEWVLYICSMLFAAPILRNEMTDWQWTFGSITIFLAWFNCLLFLQRFDFYGIYVVMFLEILRTLLQVLMVFSILLIAFGMAFFMLLRHEPGSHAFFTPGLSLLRMAMMMLELDFVASFGDPYTDNDPDTLYFGGTTIFLLVIFVLLMPILLMNLLIGLAVGDIVSVQKNATLKRLAMQVELHTDLERKLPLALLNSVNKPDMTLYPNRCDGYVKKFWNMLGKISTLSDSGDSHMGQHQNLVYEELFKQKCRMKEMSGSLQKQHDLLRLIVQKMEIETEDENKDEGDHDDDLAELAHGTKWTRSSHRLVKQKAVVANWKTAMSE